MCRARSFALNYPHGSSLGISSPRGSKLPPPTSSERKRAITRPACGGTPPRLARGGTPPRLACGDTPPRLACGEGTPLCVPRHSAIIRNFCLPRSGTIPVPAVHWEFRPHAAVSFPRRRRASVSERLRVLPAGAPRRVLRAGRGLRFACRGIRQL